MEDLQLVPTDGSTGGDGSTTDVTLTTTTPGGVTEPGIGGLITDQADAQTAGGSDELTTILAGIPETDDDLTSFAGNQLDTIRSQRNQLRAIGKAYREVEPLRIYQTFGNPEAVKSRLEIANLLYSPLRGPDNKPVLDPITRTPYVTPRPFIEYLDKNSPGLIEQMLVDLLAYPTEITGPDGQPRLGADGKPARIPMVNQVFAHYGLDISRLPEYRNIDKLIATTTGAVTPEELAEIPTEYHAAYRTIPASIRNAWNALDDADKTRTLETYKRELDRAARDAEDAKAAERTKQAAEAEYARKVAVAQDKYLDTVRRERTAHLIQSFAKQGVTFSADAIQNRVMLGSLAATMAQLLDPTWRFVVVDEVLTPLGLKLDHTFDAALESFNANALSAVALEEAGDRVQAAQVRDASVSAANQLMAKLWPLALEVAKRQGATVKARADAVNTALATANPGRRVATSTPNSGNPNNPYLPEGVRPGTREAMEHLARQSGYMPS